MDGCIAEKAPGDSPGCLRDGLGEGLTSAVTEADEAAGAAEADPMALAGTGG
ncbi:MAG: hypothetical protein LBJ61_06090 [Deltaproteobacteria bacterium]|jgi:hypothetical protein|nr:hypothetical protein [Deltaproteobacteria bacterium]